MKRISEEKTNENTIENIEKIGSIIDYIINQPGSSEITKAIMKDPKKLESKGFEKEIFCKLAIKGWSKDFLDSLIVFYKLNELNIKYRVVYSNKKNKSGIKSYKKNSKGDVK